MKLHALTRSSSVTPQLTAKLSFFIYILLSYIVVQFGPIPSLLVFTPFMNSKIFEQINRIQLKNAVENAMKGNRSRRHAIVFDAGSTGTRIHVFEFMESYRLGRELMLEAEHFNQVMPGLSSYSSNPREAANSLIPLLKIANSVIAEEDRHHTPIILKATAGLRLLESHKATSIVNSVKNFFSSVKPSYRVHESSVSILDGEAEGVFAWFTVNFLLNTVDSSESVSVLDLGGGSTQVTFAPLCNQTVVNFNEHITSKVILDQRKELYARSYLGYGLLSARKSILNLQTKSVNSSDKMVRLKHPCFQRNVNVYWRFENVDYIVEGDEDSIEDCSDVVKRFVESSDASSRIDSPEELNDRPIYAISFYYDRALDVGLIDNRVKRSVLTVNDYYLASQVLCNENFNESRIDVTDRQETVRRLRHRRTAILHDKPFICLDLTYIWTFLNSGLNLELSKQITIVNKIDDVATSWALGAAFSLLYS